MNFLTKVEEGDFYETVPARGFFFGEGLMIIVFREWSLRKQNPYMGSNEYLMF